MNYDASGGGGSPSVSPIDALDTPYPSQPIPDSFEEIIDFTSWLNPVEYLRKALDFVMEHGLGVNPAEEVEKWVAGDWKGVAIASSALDQLSEYVRFLAREVNDDSSEMLLSWDGNAATSAHGYFQTLAVDLEEVGQNLRGLATEYQTVAAGVQDMAMAVGGLMHDMEDKLIEMGIKLIATAALSETIIGSLIAGAWAISDAHKVIEMWTRCREAYELAVKVGEAFVGACARYLGALDEGNNLALPRGYDSPVV
jgi:hypothetical protein